MSFTRKRLAMVRKQIAGRGILQYNILKAMATVPRHLFVPAEYQQYAYDDQALPIPAGQTISQPYIVAWMIKEARIRPGDNILEVGTGSGYAAAILSQLAKQIHTIERHAELASYAQQRLDQLGLAHVHIHITDGTVGSSENAPYQVIIVAANGPSVPPSLKDQLAVGGRLVMPIGPKESTQELIRITRTSPTEFDQEPLGAVRFVPLIGQQGW